MGRRRGRPNPVRVARGIGGVTMTTKQVRVGEKFPEEEKIQSMHSPSVVADEEVVERELRRSEEMSGAGGPTEAAFPRKQLLGRNGSGLSVNRLSGPEARKKDLMATSREAPSHARAGVRGLRSISDRQGQRTVSVVDAGTEDNPKHAEIYMRLQGTCAHQLETRVRILRAFGG